MLHDRRYRAAAATAAANVLGRPISMLLSVAAVAIAVRTIGQEAYGVMVMCLTATTWLTVLDGGLTSSSINRIVQACSGGDSVRGVVSAAFFYMLAIGTTAAVVIASAAYLTGLPELLDPGGAGSQPSFGRPIFLSSPHGPTVCRWWLQRPMPTACPSRSRRSAAWRASWRIT